MIKKRMHCGSHFGYPCTSEKINEWATTLYILVTLALGISMSLLLVKFFGDIGFLVWLVVIISIIITTQMKVTELFEKKQDEVNQRCLEECAEKGMKCKYCPFFKSIWNPKTNKDEYVFPLELKDCYCRDYNNSPPTGSD